MTITAADVLAVDLGKTACRVRRDRDGWRVERRGEGFLGLANRGGASAAAGAIAAVVGSFEPGELDGATTIAIGAAGADSDPVTARRTARLVRERWGWEVAIASDVLTAHLGAFAGDPGTILIAGTGAVAYSIRSDGTRLRSDGAGPWLGDEGSGRWIGQAGLVAVMRHADGRGAPTRLVEDAAAVFGAISDLPRAIGGDAGAPRRLASFAPAVLARADQDPISARIVGEAIDHLVRAVEAVAPPGESVAVLGGLVSQPSFRRGLVAQLAKRGFIPRRPEGSAMDGAVALAVRRESLHERYAIRV